MKTDIGRYDPNAEIGRGLTRITALVDTAYGHTGVPTDIRHCLDQLSAEVQGLKDAHDRATTGRGLSNDADHSTTSAGSRQLAELTVNWTQAGPGQERTLRTLTPKEVEVLQLITEGRSNREIAGELFLAEKTVKNYVSNLLRKLGLERRTQAAVLAMSLGRTSSDSLGAEPPVHKVSST